MTGALPFFAKPEMGSVRLIADFHVHAIGFIPSASFVALAFEDLQDLNVVFQQLRSEAFLYFVIGLTPE